MKKFLDLYQQSIGTPQFTEDLHYSFVEYQGGNITHWSFLDEETGINVDRLCGRAMVVTDQDDKQKRRLRHDKLQALLSDRFVCLPCREIENLISAEVLRKLVRQYEKDDDVQLKNFKEDDYKSVYLGKFIEDKVLVGPSKRRGNAPYADNPGTVKDKVKFCHQALNHTNSIDDMSDSAKTVAKQIYQFILDRNTLHRFSTNRTTSSSPWWKRFES